MTSPSRVAVRDHARSTRVLARIHPRTTLLVGLLGSVAIGVGALFVGRLAPTHSASLLVALQHTSRHRRIGYSAVIVGLVVLTAAWVVLGLQSRGRPDGVRRVLTATGAWSVPVLVTPPLFSGDVWSYVANGMIVARHLSPYVVTPSALTGPIVHAVSPRWRGTPAPYGPLPLIWGGGVSHVSSSPWFGLLGFRLLALIGLALLAFGLLRLARATGRDPVAALWLAVASPFTLAQGISSPHVDLLLAGLAACAVALALGGRWVLASVLVGLAAAVKIPALLVGVPVLLAAAHGVSGPPWRTRVRFGALVVAVSLATVWVLGAVSGLGLGWLTGLSSPLSSKTPLSLTTQIGFRLGRTLHHPLVGEAHTIGSVLIVLAVAYVVFRTPVGAPHPVLKAAVAVTVVSVLLSPIVHYWYFFWCLPFLAAARLPPGGRRIATASTAALGLLAPFDLSEGLPHAYPIMLAALLAAMLSGLDVRRLRERLRPSATTST